MDSNPHRNQGMLSTAYYVSLVLLLPGAALATFAYLFNGMLGDMYSIMGKIEHMFPRDWGWQWGYAVIVLLFLIMLAVVVFIGIAGSLDRYRPYAATILFAIAAMSLVTLVRDPEFRAAPIAWFCFAMSPISILASGFVMWKMWIHT